MRLESQKNHQIVKLLQIQWFLTLKAVNCHLGQQNFVRGRSQLSFILLAFDNSALQLIKFLVNGSNSYDYQQETADFAVGGF